MIHDSKDIREYVDAIRASGLSIYDPIEVGHPRLWIPTLALEELLNRALVGVSLTGLPLRTRSRVVKELVCKALGYPVPGSFQRSKPRFPGQALDTYVQKSDNLQVWNEELEPTRRYALIRVSADHTIRRVKVILGKALALLDTTGTLTQKYQARLVPGKAEKELVTRLDTEVLLPFVGRMERVASGSSPIDWPQPGQLLAVAQVFELLGALIGTSFPDRGHDQERNRGGDLHEIVCRRLGYQGFRDAGQFPDIRHQLLEIKLQASPTIDLGLVCPDSVDGTGLPKMMGRQIRHCDVRYALFYASIGAGVVHLDRLYVTTGQGFFRRFPRFEGRVVNKKLQIRLPSDLFDA